MTGTNAEQTLNLETDAGWRAHIKSLPCLYEHLTTWSRQAYPDDALTCSLYRYYDGDGGLLYVGISSDFATRDKAHYVAGRWRARACYATVEVFPDRMLAEAAEEYAIETQSPPWNVRVWSGRAHEVAAAPAWWKAGRKLPWWEGDCRSWALVCCELGYYSPRLLDYNPFDLPATES